MTIIYKLREPGSEVVEYVGLTEFSAKKRLIEHMKYAKTGTSAVGRWIQKLISRGCWPEVDIIETCNSCDSLERERYWIKHYLSINPNLKNGTHANSPFGKGKKRPRRAWDDRGKRKIIARYPMER